MDGSRKARELFLYGMSLVYLFAFGSWFVQLPGLYGNDGILPVKNTLERMQMSDRNTFNKPNAILPLLSYGFSPQTSLELICLAGVILSFLCLIFRCMCSMPVCIIMWFLYFSIYQLGHTFSSFQWDILLLEAGFITCFIAPMTPFGRNSSLYRIPFFLAKWLLFRLMYASGIVKLTSNCPTWWGLTALNYHFETQCIPTPMAWWAHQLPQWFLQLGVVGTYVIEIALPFLLFSPVRKLRLIAVYGQVLLMVAIILTGNYNFFNFLTIVLCLSAVDDEHLSIYGVKSNKRKTTEFGTKNFRKLRKFTAALTTIAVIAGFVYYTVEHFGLTFFKNGNFLHSTITFQREVFKSWVDDWTTTGIWIGSIFFALESLYTLYLCLRRGHLLQKVKEAIKFVFVFGVCTYIFTISMVPFKSVARDRNCWPVVHQWHTMTREYELVHSYGLFRSMTGVGGRPEVIITGANSAEGPWKEIEFLYKPGNTSSALPWIIPHQPRLDWQMWFAALGQYQHNPWFVSLVDKLLRGKKDVLKLIDGDVYPFKKSAPKFIKAQLYLYHFTHLKKSGGIPKRMWTRKFSREYLPAISKDHGDLTSFLKYHGLHTKDKKLKPSAGAAEDFIAAVRQYSELLPPHVFLWSLWITALLISTTRKMVANTMGK